ncbi:MAG: aspartate aminotransferase family protein [Vicinamibacterales bacterium]
MSRWSDRYRELTPGSQKLFERAQRVLPGGVSYQIRDLPPYPFYVSRAAGARVYDVDGNEYADYWCGHGALILGHAPAPVVAALARQVELGTHWGFAHPLEVRLAEMISSRVRSAEMVRYTASGTEANMYAVALARAVTGRRAVAKIEGGWHGGCETLNKAVRQLSGAPESAGLSEAALGETVVVPFNDLEKADEALRRHHPACLFVEPMLGAAGFIPAEPGYLAGLASLCEEHGTLLVFDEVITGFRIAPGGAQEYFGVTPHISILGKIVGGGLPVGAICGRREIFERLDHRRFQNAAERVFQGGTFIGNPMTMTAGIATLEQLGSRTPYDYLAALGEEARSSLEAIFDRFGVDAAVTGLESTFCLHFRKGKPKNAREAADSDKAMARGYFEFMLANGVVFLSPPLPHMFLSTAHTREDIARLLQLTEDFLRA